MRLAKAILVRLIFGVLSLLFVSFVAFVADEAAPGDASTALAGEKADAATRARIRENLGLNRPWPIRYAEFVGNAAKGDFGKSYAGTKEDVRVIIARNLPMTLRIASLAILLAALVGITLGTIAAVYENRFSDRTILLFSTLGITVPNFVLAPLLVYVFSLKLDVLPQSWEVEQRAPLFFYLALPVLVLSLRPMTMLTRLTRASMVETIKQEFFRLAIAKGVPPRRLIFSHALRNAILPVITSASSSFGFLLTGSFVVERYFTLPGIGREGIEAIQRGDMPVVQAVVMITGAMFIAINLLVDLLLPILDPRIREARI